eukprot:scaffold111590_cov75-Phaeocystis_antarctica.AAC.1
MGPCSAHPVMGLQCASYTSYLILPSRGAATTLWGARGRDLLVERRGLPLAPHGRPVRRCGAVRVDGATPLREARYGRVRARATRGPGVARVSRSASEIASAPSPRRRAGHAAAPAPLVRVRVRVRVRGRVRVRVRGG